MAEMVVPVGEGHGAEGTLGVFMEGTLFVVVLLQCMNVGKLKEYKIVQCLLNNRYVLLLKRNSNSNESVSFK